MLKNNVSLMPLLFAMVSLLPLSSTAQQLDRTILPIPEPKRPTMTELDARDAKAPPRFEVKAPKGAPNVVIVLLDDIGFGQSSAFGGPAKMATLDKLAAEGLRYNGFHTTALCSPTRMALLTGRNHHNTNTGAIMELGTAFPGNTGIRPQSIAPLAEMLRQNGYSTAAFGKYHETPPWEVSSPDRMTAGPPTPASTSSTVSSGERPTNSGASPIKRRKNA
jgi:Sulfatase